MILFQKAKDTVQFCDKILRLTAPLEEGELCLIIFIDEHHKDSVYSINGCMVHTSSQRQC